jgi:predicted GIY-YIG superfamily endonuclease
MNSSHVLYRFFDATGRLLYVGITVHLPNRLTDHRHGKPWWTDVTRITLEHHPDRNAVLHAERVAIQKEHPKWNVIHNTQSLTQPAEITPQLCAEDMPDDCHDFCVKQGIASIYYPYQWANGKAHYRCQNGHSWVCWWGPNDAGHDPQWAGKPAWSMVLR